jgi:hypothetical protein
MCELMHINVSKKFHMNYYVKIKHHDQIIIKLWNHINK